jgi:hypothetical protein
VADPPNFLVLDEPTNRLDLATKEMLITAALSDYVTVFFWNNCWGNRTALRAPNRR